MKIEKEDLKTAANAFFVLGEMAVLLKEQDEGKKKDALDKLSVICNKYKVTTEQLGSAVYKIVLAE